MNIEEAKEKLHSMAYRDLQTKPYDLKLADVMQILNQIELNQPKPVVPKFVADKYEEFKHDLENFLINLCWESRAFESVFNSSDFGKWFKNSENTPIQTLINMHQFGYTVEKEKLYTVEIPNPNAPIEYHSRLAKNHKGEIVIEVQDWMNRTEYYQLTEQEIRKDFDWAWKEGFMKEVTE